MKSMSSGDAAKSSAAHRLVDGGERRNHDIRIEAAGPQVPRIAPTIDHPLRVAECSVDITCPCLGGLIRDDLVRIRNELRQTAAIAHEANPAARRCLSGDQWCGVRPLAGREEDRLGSVKGNYLAVRAPSEEIDLPGDSEVFCQLDQRRHLWALPGDRHARPRIAKRKRTDNNIRTFVGRQTPSEKQVVNLSGRNHLDRPGPRNWCVNHARAAVRLVSRLLHAVCHVLAHAMLVGGLTLAAQLVEAGEVLCDFLRPTRPTLVLKHRRGAFRQPGRDTASTQCWRPLGPCRAVELVPVNRVHDWEIRPVRRIENLPTVYMHHVRMSLARRLGQTCLQCVVTGTRVRCCHHDIYAALSLRSSHANHVRTYPTWKMKRRHVMKDPQVAHHVSLEEWRSGLAQSSVAEPTMNLHDSSPNWGSRRP